MPKALTLPVILSLSFFAPACGAPPAPAPECPPTAIQRQPDPALEKLQAPTVAEAEAFIASVEKELLQLWIKRERMAWVMATYITHDTELLAAEASEAVMAFIAEKSAQSVRYDKLNLPPQLRRKLNLLKLSLSLPAPRDEAKRSELARISSEMESIYAKGTYCPSWLKGKCLDLGSMSEQLAKSRDADKLLDLWRGWRTVSPAIRPLYQRYVELGNEGARELGFSDLGALWRSRYDMSPADFEKEVDRLWGQVEPLYQQLHCYARAKLRRVYGKDKIPATGPIPAHLLGNMWAQDWSNLFELLSPGKGRATDLEAALKRRKVDEQQMVRYGEGFFVSLGMDKLPASFWERSLFSRPQDREVVCHASAWDVDYDQDLRIKMCIKVNGEDFSVIHHELGHNYYQYYYRHQPTLFRDSANAGFHEALGDTISLSVTPAYLQRLGLLPTARGRIRPEEDLKPLMRRALDKVAFLPFGLIIDKWRWGVFSGQIKPQSYNRSWWELRQQYQGVAAPMARSEEAFDPGAKYHIPANVPYTRYFLATILQFQFHRALCQAIGHEGPLHTCSIYGNKEAGRRLVKMMAMGQSQPWVEALEVLTGKRQMDASAIQSYFEPLYRWLQEQNKDQTCGW